MKNTGCRQLGASASIDRMPNDETKPIAIILSPLQIDEVVRAASESRAPSLSTLIADSLRASRADRLLARDRSEDPGGPSPLADARGYAPADTDDPRLSRSLLRGLSILTCFGPAGEPRGIVELATELGMSPSTTHRYALTLVELGLLERCPRTRKYRLPAALTHEYGHSAQE
jgi:DNA-binding MarR family transcriptional regulator